MPRKIAVSREPVTSDLSRFDSKKVEKAQSVIRSFLIRKAITSIGEMSKMRAQRDALREITWKTISSSETSLFQ